MSVRIVAEKVSACLASEKEAKISEIAAALEMSRKECIEKLLIWDTQLREIGYALIPVSAARIDAKEHLLSLDSTTTEYTHVLSSFSRCDHVCLIKTRACTEEEVYRVTKNVHWIVFTACIINLNGSDIEYSKVVRALERAGETEETLKQIVKKKYLRKYTKNEVAWLRIGWRFFVEYPGFSFTTYIQRLRSIHANNHK